MPWGAGVQELVVIGGPVPGGDTIVCKGVGNGGYGEGGGKVINQEN